MGTLAEVVRRRYERGTSEFVMKDEVINNMELKENKALWDLIIPGRDTREVELNMIPSEIDNHIDSIDKYAHSTCLAYASASYLIDIIEELYHVRDAKGLEARTKIVELCINKYIDNIIMGLNGAYGHVYDEQDEYRNNWINSLEADFEAMKTKIGCIDNE